MNYILIKQLFIQPNIKFQSTHRIQIYFIIHCLYRCLCLSISYYQLTQKQINFVVLTERYYVELECDSQNEASLTIIQYENCSFKKKYWRKIRIGCSQNRLVYFQSFQELRLFLEDPLNWTVLQEQNVLMLKWNFICTTYTKQFNTLVHLETGTLGQIQHLRCSNKILRAQLLLSVHQGTSNTQGLNQNQQKDDKVFEQQNKHELQQQSKQNQQEKHTEGDKIRKCQIIKRGRGRPKFKDQDSESHTFQGETIQENDLNLYRIRGKVKINYPNGDYYLGYVKNGQFHGRGKFNSVKGGSFQGQYRKGKKNGYGRNIDENGNKMSGLYYEDKRNGKGKDEYINGQVYEGDYVDDLRSGFGKYQFKDGSFYEGQWRMSMAHGKGVEVYPDGSQFQGEWVTDEKNGKGYFYRGHIKKMQYWNMGKLLNEHIIQQN